MYGRKRTRIMPTFNAGWVEGAEVHYVGAHSRSHAYTVCTIKRVLKTGHAVIDWTNHAGVTVERKFRLGQLTYAQEMTDGSYYRQYIARICLVTPERLKEIAESSASTTRKERLNALREAMRTFTFYGLTDEQLSALESVLLQKKEGES